MIEIKILGAGCANCHKLEEATKTAVKELGVSAKIEKISDIKEIIKFTMSMPGLVINGKLKYSGKPLPDIEKIKNLIKEESQ